MRRTIPELIAAVFAGEPITLEERHRLLHRRPRQRHWPYLQAGLSPLDAVQRIRADILRDLRHYTPTQCRSRLREVLHLLTEYAAVIEGQKRGFEARQQRGREATNLRQRDQRSQHAERASVLADERGRITKAAVRRQLKADAEQALKEKRDAPWLSATTKAEQDAMVKAEAQRLRRARKKRGQ